MTGGVLEMEAWPNIGYGVGQLVLQGQARPGHALGAGPDS
jgi:hypothetical protein